MKAERTHKFKFLRGVTLNAMIFLAMAVGAGPANAEFVRNSYATFSGDRVDVMADGDFYYDVDGEGEMVVTAADGWLVNGSESVTVYRDRNRGQCLGFQSKLGEGSEGCHVFPHSVLGDVHKAGEAVSISAWTPSAAYTAVYAAPDDVAKVAAPVYSKVEKKGLHVETREWKRPCSCGTYPAFETDVREYEVVPDVFVKRVRVGREASSRDVSEGRVSLLKGENQHLEYTVAASRKASPECALCAATASAEALADVYELSVSMESEYLGLDMTDAARGHQVSRTATARIDPNPKSGNHAVYRWTDCGTRCEWSSSLSASTVKYRTDGSKGPSSRYREEPLVVEGTVYTQNWLGPKVSAACTNRFTIVKVDVEVGQIGEDDEEVKGALLSRVEDNEDGISLSARGTRALAAVHIACKPKLPDGETVNIMHLGSGQLFKRKGALHEEFTDTAIRSEELENLSMWLHGHKASASMGNDKIQVTHAKSKAVDFSKYTVVSFDWIKVECCKMPASGSFGTNPVVFGGECLDFKQPEAVRPKWNEPGTKVFQVFYKYIKDSATDMPSKFDIKFDAQILPADFLKKCNFYWTQTDGPNKESLSNVKGIHAELANPTATGVTSSSKHVYKYRLKAELDGFSVESEAWVMLPRAGGEISNWLQNEIPIAARRASDWRDDVVVDCMTKCKMTYGEAAEFAEGVAWRYVASDTFDYQGVAGDPTPRYSYVDKDLPVSEQDGNDWNDPSYATLKGIVVSRSKINNLLYAVWGRVLNHSTFALKRGAVVNAWTRGQWWDNPSSQAAIQLGGELYDRLTAGLSLSACITQSRAKELQTADTPDGLNDVNLWPNSVLANSGFMFPRMPTDYETLKDGMQAERDRR